MKIVPIKMTEKEIETFKKVRVQAMIDGKRVGTWIAEAIEEKLKIRPRNRPVKPKF